MNPYDNPADGRRPGEKPASVSPLEGFTSRSNQQDQHHIYPQQQHHPQQRQRPGQSQLHQSDHSLMHPSAVQASSAASSRGNPVRPVAMLADEDSRQSSAMSEGFLNAMNGNQTFAFGSGTSSGSAGLPPSPKTKSRQATHPQPYPPMGSGQQSIPSPPLTRQGPEQPVRQYYSLLPGSDQPQLLHDYRPSSAQDAALDPASGKSKKIPSGISAGKIYVCMGYGECSKTFTRSEHLARHIRKHTGERPFSCHCGRAFSRLDNLRQHVSSCHAEEFVANQRTLASLGEIHTHLSIKALRDQKRAGQVIELGKEPPIKKTVKRTRTKETKKPKKSPVTTEPDSEAGPGPSTQTHRATLHNNFVPSGTAVPPVEYDMPPVGQPYAASPVQVLSASALTHPMPNSEMTQSSVPITRLSPGYAIRHQPFGPYGRPWTAGRPETNVTQGNGHHTRPMTQNSNPDSRPPTANVHHGYVNYMQQPVVGSNHAMPSVYMPEDRPVSSCERVNNGIQRQFVGDVPGMHNSPHEPSSTMRMGINHMDRSDLQESYRIQPSPGYVYNEQPGVHRRVVMNSQVPPQYTRSPYEPVPLRSQIGSVAYDGLASVPPTPQTMQYNSQGRLLPGGSSSNPSYTSSGSMPSRNSRQSGVSSSGQSYIPEHGMQHFRSIGAASSSQVAEIYGNSVGAQESPFSYHPPPTATHPPSAPLGGQFEPVAGQMYYPNPEPVTGDVPYGMPPSMQQHDNHALGQSGAQPDMAHYLMSGRHERRRPSLPIMSLIDADPTQGSAPRVTDSTNGHHPLPQEAVYYTMPYQQAQNQVQGGYSNGMSSTGYSFPNNGLPVSSVYQGAAGPPSVQNGHRPQQHQVGWQQHTSEDPLVGQMDAKARALLGGNGGSFGM